MVARLQHELDSRKDLVARLKAAQAARRRAGDAAAGQKACLEALQAALRGLDQAGRPLLSLLGPRLERRGQQRAAALLPTPLWVIYSQFSAGRDALGLAVGVDVEGSVEDAARLAAAGAVAAAGGGGREGSGGGGGGGGGGVSSAAGGGKSGGSGGPPPSKRRKEGEEQVEEGVYQVRNAALGAARGTRTGCHSNVNPPPRFRVQGLGGSTARASQAVMADGRPPVAAGSPGSLAWGVPLASGSPRPPAIPVLRAPLLPRCTPSQ
jgi:hypothetical protein